MKAPAKKIPFEDVGISTWAPTKEGQPWIAIFDGLPMIFKAASEREADVAARNWRTEEMAKAARKIENGKASAERLKAMRSANGS